MTNDEEENHYFFVFGDIELILQVRLKVTHKAKKYVDVNYTDLSKVYKALFKKALFIHVTSEGQGLARKFVTVCELDVTPPRVVSDDRIQGDLGW